MTTLHIILVVLACIGAYEVIGCALCIVGAWCFGLFRDEIHEQADPEVVEAELQKIIEDAHV